MIVAPCTIITSPMSDASAVPEAARQGRDNQRYSPSGERLVAGCIPVRFVHDGSTPSDVEVMLISSSGGSGWVFPKGGWELDETAESAALRETVEEGGVRGDLDPQLLGTYPYSNRKTSPTRKGCIAHMFAMVVKEELSVWPESERRERCWFSVDEASTKCRHGWMRTALHDWLRRQGWDAVADRLDNVSAAASSDDFVGVATPADTDC